MLSILRPAACASSTVSRCGAGIRSQPMTSAPSFGEADRRGAALAAAGAQ